MKGWQAIFKRELASYFATPVAAVFAIVFLMLVMAMTFYLGDFFVRDQADLQSFFYYHPWLFLFLVPAIAMRLWSEDRRLGTFELLLTLPVSTFAVVLGKFLAAWVFIGIVLALTFPIWITVNYLGSPDNGVIIASYIGSFMMAGSVLGLGAALSALTRNQIIAFIGTAAITFILMFSGLPIVQSLFQGWAPDSVITMIASFSFLNHFSGIMKGVIEGRDILFFLSLAGFWLYVNTIIVDQMREAG